MATLAIFSEQFVDALRNGVAGNLNSYQSTTPFVTALGSELPVDIRTSLELDDNFQLIEGGDNVIGNGDAQNAAIIHRALADLTPAQATDARLWTRMAHVDCWSYMRIRWPIERFADDKSKAIRFVVSRYFIAQSQSRALTRHGIARLWWAAYLTADQNRDNPYELTEILLSKLDIAQQILERSIGRSRPVLVGFLSFLSRNAESLLSGGEANRQYIRALAKFLNLTGGVLMLDALQEEKIVELLERHFESITRSPEVAGTAA